MSERIPSPFAIESILPEGNRRFLQIRKSFLHLTQGSAIRAGILECALFRMGLLMVDLDLEERQERHAILSSGSPEKAELWAPTSNAELQRRMGGLASTTAIADGIKWLSDQGLLSFKRGVGEDATRHVTLHAGEIEHRLRTSATFGPDSLKWEKDHRTQIELPGGRNPRIYEGLVDAIAAASNSAGPDVARASVLLDQMLMKSRIRLEAEEDIMTEWSASKAATVCGWADRRTWKPAIALLRHSGLLIVGPEMRKRVSFEPNLGYLNQVTESLSSPDLASEVIVRFTPTHRTDHANPRYGSRQPTERIAPIHNSESANGELLKEGILFDHLFEKRGGGEPEVAGSPVPLPAISREYREKNFKATSVPGNLYNAYLGDLDPQAVSSSSTMRSAADGLWSGSVPAIAIFESGERARATAAALLGHWVDRKVRPIRPVWFEVPRDSQLVIDGDWDSPARKELMEDLEQVTPLVIENITSVLHPKASAALAGAIQRRRHQAPIIFVGVPRDSDSFPTAFDPLLASLIVDLVNYEPINSPRLRAVNDELEETG